MSDEVMHSPEFESAEPIEASWGIPRLRREINKIDCCIVTGLGMVSITSGEQQLQAAYYIACTRALRCELTDGVGYRKDDEGSVVVRARRLANVLDNVTAFAEQQGYAISPEFLRDFYINDIHVQSVARQEEVRKINSHSSAA